MHWLGSKNNNFQWVSEWRSCPWMGFIHRGFSFTIFIHFIQTVFLRFFFFFFNGLVLYLAFLCEYFRSSENFVMWSCMSLTAWCPPASLTPDQCRFLKNRSVSVQRSSPVGCWAGTCTFHSQTRGSQSEDCSCSKPMQKPSSPSLRQNAADGPVLSHDLRDLPRTRRFQNSSLLPFTRVNPADIRSARQYTQYIVILQINK